MLKLSTYYSASNCNLDYRCIECEINHAREECQVRKHPKIESSADYASYWLASQKRTDEDSTGEQSEHPRQ